MEKPKTLLEQIEERGINKSWLARKINIKTSTLSNYLHGIRVMPEKVEKDIREILN
jgi:ribosome-binding protein aMBF1 (putative translation factor)